jgi:tRNA A37 N6-isopentenylltransferase MiaA
MDHEALTEARAVIGQQWQLSLPEEGNQDLLLEALAERIESLLETDKPKLMRALYILDVTEKRYKAAIARPTVSEAALALAQAVLDRETEKIASRRKYAQAPGQYLSDIFEQDTEK